MTDKTFVVRFKARELSTQRVTAAQAEIYAEHMVLLNSTGKLAALFLLEALESWTDKPVDRMADQPRCSGLPLTRSLKERKFCNIK
jgi:hypothetical protein